PALMMITSYQFTPLSMMAWIGACAFLGVFVAIPLKRQMVNIERLPFPSGIAAAETVKSLHAEGGEARTKAKALGWASLFGAAVGLVREGMKPLCFPNFVPLFGKPAAMYTIQLETSLIMPAAGAIMGLRSALSALAGSLLCYGVLAPWA